jgi:hypothetical protein
VYPELELIVEPEERETEEEGEAMKRWAIQGPWSRLHASHLLVAAVTVCRCFSTGLGAACIKRLCHHVCGEYSVAAFMSHATNAPCSKRL